MSVGRSFRRLCLVVVVVAAGLGVFVGVSGATGVGVSWSAPTEVAPLGGQGYMDSVSCPTASQCTAVDWSGQELTFDPQNPGARIRHVIDAGTYGAQLTSVDCVSAQQCTAVESGYEVTFEPVSGAVLEMALVAPIENLDSVSCPTASLCTAVGTAEVAFDPLTGAVTPAGVTDVKPDHLAAVYCVSATQCTSVDTGFARTFDPTTGQLNGAGVVRLNGGTMTTVTCPTSTECIGGDGSGNEIPFNPISGAPIGPGKENWGMGIYTLSISCTSASTCTSVDYDGGTRTFNPQTGTLASPGETALNAGHLQSVACLAAGCVTVSSSGNEVTFDPAAPGAAVVTGIDTAQGMLGVSCSSATQCTAVGGDASEVTFDPATGTVLSSAGEAGLDTRAFAVVSCPSDTQCTAVLHPTYAVGDTVTFNPQTGAANDLGIWTSVSGAHAPSGLVCPTVTQCTLVDTAGDEVTFDPTTGVRWGSVVRNLNLGGMEGLACPTTTQCTTVNTANQELTWNPLDGSFAVATPVSITGTDDIPFTAVSCPSTAQCTGVGTDGSEITFDPTQGVAIDGGAYAIDHGHYLSAISCPTETRCVAVDRSARSIAFDPAKPGARNITPLPGAAALSGVACASSDACAAISGIGQAFSGTFVPVLTPDTELNTGPADPTYTTDASFSFSSYDANATFECSLDGAGWQACTSPASYTGLSTGSHTFSVQAWNGSLSDPSPPSQTWTIAPSDVHIDGGPANPSAVTVASFSFSSHDSAATFKCKLDSSAFQTCASPAAYSGLSPGSHTFAVEAVNDGGVPNPTPATRTWLIAPPEQLKVTKVGSGTVRSSPAEILCGSTCSGVFDWGTTVTLTASPAKNFAFTGWSGAGCSGTGACHVLMGGARSVTATFAAVCLVPKVAGQQLAVAKQAIVKANCAVGTITRKSSKTVKMGYVISEAPAAGRILPVRTKVNLVVSLGKAAR